MRSYDIVAYTYAADIHCPECISEMFGGSILDSTDSVLDRAARAAGIDRDDDRSFDSDDFPKIVFCDQIEQTEYCGTCHHVIVEMDDDPSHDDD